MPHEVRKAGMLLLKEVTRSGRKRFNSDQIMKVSLYTVEKLFKFFVVAVLGYNTKWRIRYDLSLFFQITKLLGTKHQGASRALITIGKF